MKTTTTEWLGMIALAGAGALMAAAPAQALTMQECSAKYNTAKTAGTLGGKTWNDFRKAECGSDATAATPAAVTPAAPKAAEAKPADASKPATTAAAPAGPAVFPKAVDANMRKKPSPNSASKPASISTTSTRRPTPTAE